MFVCCSFFTHASKDGYPDWFHMLAMVTSAMMDMGVQVFLSHADFVSFTYVSRSGIAGSYGRSIFSFWRNFHTVLQNGCTHLHSHQYPCLFLFFFAFCIIAIRTRNDALIVVLFGIFLMANDIEHFFHIYVRHLYSFWEMLIQVFCPINCFTCKHMIFFNYAIYWWYNHTVKTKEQPLE